MPRSLGHFRTACKSITPTRSLLASECKVATQRRRYPQVRQALTLSGIEAAELIKESEHEISRHC